MSDYSVYLTYREYRTGGEPNDPDDRWTSYSDEYVDFTPTALFKARDNSGIWAHGLTEDELFGEFEQGDIGHLLVVRYSTGDTFSHVNGYWYIIGLFKDPKEADGVENSIYDDSYEGYKPWIGYFESLENVELHTMVVQ